MGWGSEFSDSWGKRGEGGQGREGVQLPDSLAGGNCTVKVHKSMKSIARILHLPSVVHNLTVMKRREYFLYRNKTKITTFIQRLGTVTSPLCQPSAILEMIPWTQNTQSSASASIQGCVFFDDLRSALNINSAPLWPG